MASSVTRRCRPAFERTSVLLNWTLAFICLLLLLRPDPSSKQLQDVKSDVISEPCEEKVVYINKCDSLVNTNLVASTLAPTPAPTSPPTPPPTVAFRVTGNVQSCTAGRSIFESPAEPFKFERKLSPELSQRLAEKERWASDNWDKELTTLLAENTLEGVVIIALANFGMREMTMNWAASLLRNGFTKFLILCFDFRMYAFLSEYGMERNAAVVPRAWLHKDIRSDFQQWEQEGYNDLLHGKIKIMLQLWGRGITMFYNDVDLVFLSPYVLRHLLMEDANVNTDFFYMSDFTGDQGDHINGGFWIGRPTKMNIDLWTRTFELAQQRRDKVVDQYAFNHVLDTERAGLKFTRAFRPMSKLLYTGGYYLHKLGEAWNEKVKMYPMVVHVNFLVGNGPKKAMLRRFNMWYIGDTFA